MGLVDIIQSGSEITITIDGDTGDISAGVTGQDGDLIIKDSAGTERIRLNGQTGSVTARSAAMVEVFGANGDTGQLILRGVNAPGHGSPRITLSPVNANIAAGGNGQAGDIILSDANGHHRVNIVADKGNLFIRDAPKGGQGFGQIRILLGGESGRIELRDPNGKDQIRLEGSNIWVGGNDGDDGDIVLFAKEGNNATTGNATIHLDGGGANIWLGGNGVDSDLLLMPSTATDNHDRAQATIWLDGEAGDIILRNADCAEEFDVSDSEEVEPGTVMVLDQEGKLRASQQAYDKKVAGVISGAGDIKPGIVLDKRHSQTNRMPVALVGKVYCKVDAQYAPIEAGDLLTTSLTPGCAMKAGDPLKAFGAVIGKALRPLQAGQGLIPILIALQ